MRKYRVELPDPDGHNKRPQRIVIVAPPGYDLTGASDAPFWYDLLGPDLAGDLADHFEFLRWEEKPTRDEADA